MSRLVGYQPRNVCTWCGHPPHDQGKCPKSITVAAGPSGGPGRKVSTEIIECMCKWAPRSEMKMIGVAVGVPNLGT